VSLRRFSAPILALPAQRDDELRLRAGHRFDVARIGAGVVDQDRLAIGDRGADQAAADRQAERPRDVLGIADRVGNRQIVALRIEQVDGERLEVGQARDQLGNLVQQLVEIEHRRHFAAEREQRRQLIVGGDVRRR